jgi:hypothetical protein
MKKFKGASDYRRTLCEELRARRKKQTDMSSRKGPKDMLALP